MQCSKIAATASLALPKWMGRIIQVHPVKMQPSGSAAPREADAYHKACICFSIV